MATTTISTKWGSDTVSVSADWAQASCPVYGDTRGRQVADFRHRPELAIRAALEDCAASEGMDMDAIATKAMISEAVDAAEETED